MEQKQLDEEESFFGEELVEEESSSSKTATKSKPKKEKKSSKKYAEKVVEVDKEEKMENSNEDKDEVKIIPATEKAETVEPAKPDIVDSKPVVDPWEDEDDSNDSLKSASTWKLLTGILLILLVVSVFTGGFNMDGAVTSEGITLAEAEGKVLDYVNTNLLQAPFTAELESSEDAGSLYKLTILVAGQKVDSYITKDGKIFFPQGFQLDEISQAATTESAKLDVSIDDDAVKGNADAPITIVEFSEFQCPFCKKFFDETYLQIVKDYVDTGKVKYVFRDFPLEFHPNAQKAAEAAECAGEQGKYWEMHDALFTNQDKLDIVSLKSYAKELKLNTVKFDACLDNGDMAEEVKKDAVDGQSYGVSGTPAFFINGKLISGAMPYSAFVTEIEAALAEVEGATVPVDNSPEELVVVEDPVEVVEPVVEKPAVEVVATKEFAVTAKKWFFSPAKLTVNKGDSVKVTIVPNALDFTFSVPQFGVENEVKGNTVIEFTADQVGTFEFKCSSCEDWRGMTGTLVVE